MSAGLAYYADQDVSLDRNDIRSQQCLSVDLRAQTGMGNVPDESCVVEPGTFTLSVCGQVPGELPIGEIRLYYPPLRGEIRLVGHLTGRPGVRELTPDHLLASEQDAAYRDTILQWLGVSG